jgi:hypothetical protein
MTSSWQWPHLHPEYRRLTLLEGLHDARGAASDSLETSTGPPCDGFHELTTKFSRSQSLWAVS